MITVTQRKKMKKVLGARYSKRVQELMNEKGILNKKNEPFSIAYISHVFNGRNSDIRIETTILELYQKVRYDQEQLRKEKKQILENKKPEAVTSGF